MSKQNHNQRLPPRWVSMLLIFADGQPHTQREICEKMGLSPQKSTIKILVAEMKRLFNANGLSLIPLLDTPVVTYQLFKRVPASEDDLRPLLTAAQDKYGSLEEF